MGQYGLARALGELDLGVEWHEQQQHPPANRIQSSQNESSIWLESGLTGVEACHVMIPFENSRGVRCVAKAACNRGPVFHRY